MYQDALSVARNLRLSPALVMGGGAVEMAVCQALQDKANTVTGVKQWPYSALAQALEVTCCLHRHHQIIYHSLL